MFDRFSRLSFTLPIVAALASLVFGGIVAAADEPIRIAIAGDSTVRDYTRASGEYAVLRGWGQYLGEYLETGRVEIVNHAVGGRSSKSFLTEGLWRKLLEEKPAYVLIQFGHNDIPNKGIERETKPDAVPSQLPGEGLGSQPIDWYRNNIRTYIEEARAAGATPIIVTPMERRAFKSNGKAVREKNKPWADAAIAVAGEMGRPSSTSMVTASSC